MFHLNTEQLIVYWRERRGADPIPRRTSIDPAHLRQMLTQVFMLERQAPGRYRFRLAGGLVADLHDRDLRQADFLDLWRLNDRTSLQMALEAVRRRGEPLVVTGTAHTRTGPAMQVEITLAPLLGPSGDADRFIGLYQPTSPVAELKGHTVAGLSVREMTTPDSDSEALPRLRLAAMHGARIA
jgi:hypothetical protein